MGDKEFGSRIALWSELVLLFFGAPLAMALGLLPGGKLFWLVAATALCLVWFARTTGLRAEALLGFRRRPDLRALALRIVLAALLLLALVLFFTPRSLFLFPRQRPLFWLLVVALYPLLSAYPQELIYRGFFFRRYAPLFPDGPGLVLASAAAFAWLHVIYHNAPAPLLSFCGGLIFAEGYRRGRSLFWTTLEHAAYGLLVFSIGLGRYFYGGPH